MCLMLFPKALKYSPLKTQNKFFAMTWVNFCLILILSKLRKHRLKRLFHLWMHCRFPKRTPWKSRIDFQWNHYINMVHSLAFFNSTQKVITQTMFSEELKEVLIISENKYIWKYPGPHGIYGHQTDVSHLLSYPNSHYTEKQKAASLPQRDLSTLCYLSANLSKSKQVFQTFHPMWKSHSLLIHS